jgi:hypothetical protein
MRRPSTVAADASKRVGPGNSLALALPASIVLQLATARNIAKVSLPVLLPVSIDWRRHCTQRPFNRIEAD